MTLAALTAASAEHKDAWHALRDEMERIAQRRHLTIRTLASALEADEWLTLLEDGSPQFDRLRRLEAALRRARARVGRMLRK
jgi:AraC-like DNA-binding protein